MTELTDLERAILAALRNLDTRLLDSERTVDMVAADVTSDPAFRSETGYEITRAIKKMADRSSFLLTLNGTVIKINGTYDQIEHVLTTPQDPRPEPTTLTREQLGQVVRDAWVRWAQQQPDPRPGWLTPWETLDADQREVDMQIGEAVAAAIAAVGKTKKEQP